VNYLAAPALAAGLYHLIASIAGLGRWLGARAGVRDEQESPSYPPVSILKPLRGRGPGFYEAIRSHALIDYPQFEILFGVHDPSDPACEDVARLAAEFPERAIRLVVCPRQLPNGKVAVLADLAREARYPVLVINDGDIFVARDYLRAVVPPLNAAPLDAKPQTGLSTCLYRARGATFPARWEALGIATDFASSVLVARALGVAEFALGSTMVLRAVDLARIGGFEAVGDYLADDYQLGRRITELGYHIVLAQAVVETRLAGETWGDIWRHQLRWSRTIRVSRPGGYFGYVITNASVWAALAAAAGAWPVAAACLAVRLLAGVVTGVLVLGDGDVARRWFLMPFRDLWGFAVWLAGTVGSTVEWQGEKLRLDKEGRIVR
jgi:ceramide glucosyltransferase